MHKLNILFLMGVAPIAYADMPTPAPRPAITILLPQPVRVLDTRLPGCQLSVIWPPENDPCIEGPFNSEETRYVQYQARGPIPFLAKGVILTVVAIEATGKGRLLLYDPFPVFAGDAETFPIETRPLASSLNFSPDHNTSSLVIVSLGQWQFQDIGVPMYPDSAIYAVISGGGTVHVVIDVIGYLQ